MNMIDKRRVFNLILPILLAFTGLIIILWFLKIPVYASGDVGLNTRIHPTLLKKMSESSPGEYLPVVIQWSQDPVLQMDTLDKGDRLSRRIDVINSLQSESFLRTHNLLQELRSMELMGTARNIRPFWIAPVIALDTQPHTIEELSKNKDIYQIRLDEPIFLDPISGTVVSHDERIQLTSAKSAPNGYLWNLEMIEVPFAEVALGLDGSGIVVANLDTGVDWQHPALQDKYRGYRPGGQSNHSGNWYVATNETYFYPGDGYGHGTHTMGIMVGDDGQGTRTGVAPGSKWIAVKLFTNSGQTFESWIHDAFQWIIAPEGDPNLAPDVVNNSWGSSIGSDDRYRGDLQALLAAGILPIFSAGNNGPGQNTIGSPGSYPEAFAVGAVDNLKVVTNFSSQGPSPWGEIKPEISAPGAGILSTYPGGGYAQLNGTSMAAPHVAGVAALLLQADPNLEPDELESIFKSMAEPLGAFSPNNQTGWGLVNAYAAGLKVTASGELMGTVFATDSTAVKNPTLNIQPKQSGPTIIRKGDTNGFYTIALLPGTYDVTASGFGYFSSTINNVVVATGTQTIQDFFLLPQPMGEVYGTVKDLESNLPLSATLFVQNTELSIQTDSVTGDYRLFLPEGSWPIKVLAKSHLVEYITPTVTAGISQEINISLEPAPDILLVDSGWWYYGSKVSYFQDALDQLRFPYQLWEIRDPFGMNGPEDRPTLDDLEQFDLVIWSAPLDSPGLIDTQDVISDYLGMGGRLLLSGQDVAYWDGGGNIFFLPTYFPKFFQLGFEGEGNLNDLVGEPKSILDSLVVSLNTPDSDLEQFHPDNARIFDELVTYPVLRWPDNSIGGVISGGCNPYRTSWLGFGFEGSGPRSTRISILSKLIDWLRKPPPDYGIYGEDPKDPLIGLPGSIITQVIKIENTGVNTETFDLAVTNGVWPFDLEFPDGRLVSSSDAVNITGCSGINITATITVPMGLPRETVDTNLLTLYSQAEPAISTTITITAKTPAPVLLVDDGLWQNYGDRYEESLGRLGIPYDLITQKGKPLITEKILNRYPLVVWTTGGDWFAPLTPNEENVMEAYLNEGGGILLSSQDLLDVAGSSNFVKTFLGVSSYSTSVTPTHVFAMPEQLLGKYFGPWKLSYPFQNWSDGITPSSDAEGILLDSNIRYLGVGKGVEGWRTAFFPFPLETLDEEAREILIGQTLLWLSPVSDSRLLAPNVAAEGSQIPITLSLRLSQSKPIMGSRAVFPLHQETSLVMGSTVGDWAYDSNIDGMVWTGDLLPGVPVTMSVVLDLNSPITDGFKLPLEALIYAGDGLTLTEKSTVLIDAPWVEVEKQAFPDVVNLGDVLNYTVTVRNSGEVSSAIYLSDTLPANIILLTDTLSSSLGITDFDQGRIKWQFILPSKTSTELTYSANVDFPIPSHALLNITEAVDKVNWRFAWRSVWVPGQMYLPVVHR